MIFIASSIYVSNFLLPQLQRELQPNIPHNMKHYRTTKFSFAKQKFSCRHIFTHGKIEAHSKIFNSQRLPSLRILYHYEYLKHIALQLSLSLSLVTLLYINTQPLFYLPSFLPFNFFLYTLTFWHFISIFLPHNSSNTNILLLKAHLYTLAFNTNKTFFGPQYKEHRTWLFSHIRVFSSY